MRPDKFSQELEEEDELQVDNSFDPHMPVTFATVRRVVVYSDGYVRVETDEYQWPFLMNVGEGVILRNG
jgi:hypothetical protein